MHTRQGVATPALAQNSASITDNYDRDAARRQQLHEALWAEEPLSWWQRVILRSEASEVRP